MKDEKEAERKVHSVGRGQLFSRGFRLTAIPATSPNHQGQEGRQGREGALREDGRKDAQEAGGEAEEEGEAKQAHQLLSEHIRADRCWGGHCD